MSKLVIPELTETVPDVPGDVAAIHTCAAELLRASSAVDDLDTTCTHKSVLAGWIGAGASAYRDLVNATGKDAAAASMALRRAAKAMWDYGDTLERLHATHTALSDWHATITAKIRTLHTDAQGATEESLPALRARADDLNRACSEFRASCADLIAEVHTNNTDLRTALHAMDTTAEATAVARQGDIADAAMTLPGAPGGDSTPQEVAAWWAGLSEDEQFAVIAAYPERVGAANGLPASARDQANRLMLNNDLSKIEWWEKEGNLTPEQLRYADNVRAAHEALNGAGLKSDNLSLYDPISGEKIPASLLLYQPSAFDGDGAIAVALGDPDTADHVAISVPGINTVGTSIGDYTNQVRNLYESARLSDPDSTTATIAWIGYNHPSDDDWLHTVTESAAIDGGHRLSAFVDGIQSSRNTETHLTVIGHSYGSTTSAHAASDEGLDADDLVLIGSPGAGGGVDHASDLHVPQVWAGNSSRDLVAALADNGAVGGATLGGAGLGNDVAEDDFGAKRFRAEDETRNSSWRNFDDHGKYYDRGTESIFNMGQIVVNDGDEVALAEHTFDPWYLPPQDPEASRTPTPTVKSDAEIRARRE